MYLLPSTSTSVEPEARAMKSGDPPTDLNARTGLSTPPGSSCVARAKSFLDLSVRIGERQRYRKSVRQIFPRPVSYGAESAEKMLAGEQREVVVMKIWGGLTFEEAAAVIGISPNTAASRYRYGLTKLKEIWK